MRYYRIGRCPDNADRARELLNTRHDCTDSQAREFLKERAKELLNKPG